MNWAFLGQSANVNSQVTNEGDLAGRRANLVGALEVQSRPPIFANGRTTDNRLGSRGSAAERRVRH
jgi:hypothetical protein